MKGRASQLLNEARRLARSEDGTFGLGMSIFELALPEDMHAALRARSLIAVADAELRLDPAASVRTLAEVEPFARNAGFDTNELLFEATGIAARIDPELCEAQAAKVQGSPYQQLAAATTAAAWLPADLERAARLAGEAENGAQYLMPLGRAMVWCALATGLEAAAPERAAELRDRVLLLDQKGAFDAVQRVRLRTALAPADADVAQLLIRRAASQLEDRDSLAVREPATPEVAALLAGIDVGRALDLVNALTLEYYRDAALSSVAVTVAGYAPDLADQLARLVGLPGFRALALAGIAASLPGTNADQQPDTSAPGDPRAWLSVAAYRHRRFDELYTTAIGQQHEGKEGRNRAERLLRHIAEAGYVPAMGRWASCCETPAVSTKANSGTSASRSNGKNGSPDPQTASHQDASKHVRTKPSQLTRRHPETERNRVNSQATRGKPPMLCSLPGEPVHPRAIPPARPSYRTGTSRRAHRVSSASAAS